MGITPDGRGLACAASAGRVHLFDGAAGGYVNLAPTHSGGGDSKEAVRARSAFLRTGYYAPAAKVLAALVRAYTPAGGFVLDAGCGEGYYTGAISEEGFPTVGIDLSKFAVDAAAKRGVRSGIDHAFFAVGSVFELPVADQSADAIVNVFAPCAEAEFLRALKPGGILAVALAGERHLMGLKRALYDVPRVNDERADLPQGMILLEEARVTGEICVKGSEAIANLFAMTPYYWRTSKADGEKLSSLETLSTEIDVRILIYQKTV
jgi:23S rRNA (guanine745-N1)-methyltransferase